MVQKLLFTCLIFLAFQSHAQFSVETMDGDPIEDGDIFTYGELEASLEFYVYNNASEDINMKIQFVGATNSDGGLMEVCFGLCYTSVNIGQAYPSSPVIIEPGQHQATSGDHFLNRDPGNGSDVITYEFRFFQLDGTGHEIGNSLTMYYQYDPLLAVEDHNPLDFTLDNTVSNGVLKVENGEPLQMALYDLQGKLVKNIDLAVGHNQIQVSDLAAQLYVVRFTNELGQAQTKKIIVR